MKIWLFKPRAYPELRFERESPIGFNKNIAIKMRQTFDLPHFICFQEI
jgi:hypothetical protein